MLHQFIETGVIMLLRYAVHKTNDLFEMMEWLSRSFLRQYFPLMPYAIFSASLVRINFELLEHLILQKLTLLPNRKYVLRIGKVSKLFFNKFWNIFISLFHFILNYSDVGDAYLKVKHCFLNHNIDNFQAIICT